jgi:hypothetical protein
MHYIARAYEVRLHLLDRLGGDVQPELLLGDGEVEPELAPGVKAVLQRTHHFEQSCCLGAFSKRDAVRTADEKRWAISLLA